MTTNPLPFAIEDEDLENCKALSAEQSLVPRTECSFQEGERVRLGLQCPECFGVRIETRHEIAYGPVVGFQCVECGCQFGSRS